MLVFFCTAKWISYMHTYIPCLSPQSLEESSLWYIRGSHHWSILYIEVYVCGEGNGTPLQHSCLENPRDMTQRLHFHFSLSCIGEGNGTHSSVLAWRIPGRVEPSGLPSMGLHRVGHDWGDSSSSSIVYICQSQTPSSPHLLFSPFVSIHLFSTFVSLFLLCK